MGELTLARADVQDPLARAHAVDEEVVVAGQPVLHVDSAVVRNGRVIDEGVSAVVDLKQLPHRLAAVRLGRDDGEPEAK